jgi:hypothetical protein
MSRYEGAQNNRNLPGLPGRDGRDQPFRPSSPSKFALFFCPEAGRARGIIASIRPITADNGVSG